MSFQQGLSGLNATSKNLEVIGNNVANASTYGAKSSRAEFADLYATAMNGSGATGAGIGVSVAAIAQQFTQGNITSTGNPLDMAIKGAGFFQVRDTNNQVLYTRNGQFKLDKDGFIVNNQLQKLMGYPADMQGVIQPGQAGPLQLPTAGINPNPTSRIAVEMNLDARAAVTLPPSGPRIDFSDATTYNNATSMTIYDAKGQDVALTYYFQKTGTDTWNVYLAANGTSIVDDGGTPPVPQPVTTIQFPADGGRPTAPSGPIAIDIPATTNSVGAETVPISGIAFNLGGATQYGSQFGVTRLNQDGFAAGKLTGVTVESNGVLLARYSNDQSRPAGQLELADFRNPQALQPLGGNAWARTYASGTPVLGVPTEGNLGVLKAGSLEESNVDLTGELVSMITAQRLYQANAQTIKTQDQVLQTLVNLR
jgi:flagellar hook protein FlgE